MSLKRVSAVIAAALVAGATAIPASATPTVATGSVNPCVMAVGTFDAQGNIGGETVVATKPPTTDSSSGKVKDKIKLFPVKESSTWYAGALTTQSYSYGMVISGSSLYSAGIVWESGDPVPKVSSKRIGGGWDRFTQIEESRIGYVKRDSSYFYGLRDDGVLFRWDLDGFKALGSYPGFSSVKTMTTISTTATYDTLLATTRGGALYTIRIPATSPMKPIVKQVRAQGWGSFDSLVAVKCGKQSTLLTAVDHDTDAAYLYAVGHATGATTPIENLGKIPAPFPGTSYHGYVGEDEGLSGE